MTGPEIINAFGGRQAIATVTGAKPAAVTQWRRIGVPSKYWDVLVEHAAQHGIRGITFVALRASNRSVLQLAHPSAAQPQQEAA